MLDSMADWANETISQPLDDLDWRAIDPSLNVGLYSRTDEIHTHTERGYD
jgi:hypothetical protein